MECVFEIERISSLSLLHFGVFLHEHILLMGSCESTYSSACSHHPHPLSAAFLCFHLGKALLCCQSGGHRGLGPLAWSLGNCTGKKWGWAHTALLCSVLQITYMSVQPITIESRGAGMCLPRAGGQKNGDKLRGASHIPCLKA